MDGLMLKHVNFAVRKKLSTYLDPEAPVSGNNWRLLAEKLLYSYDEIQALEARQTPQGSNTMKLLDEHGLSRDSTLQKLWNHLEAMGRQDTIEVLENALPDIRKAYEDEQNQTPNWVSENQSQNSGCANCCNSNPTYGRHFSTPCSYGHHQRHQVDHCYLPWSNSGAQEHNSVCSSRPYRSRSRVSSSPVSSHSSLLSGHVCNSHQTCNQSESSYRQTPGCMSNMSEVRGQHKNVGKIQNIPTPQKALHKQLVHKKPYHTMVSEEDNNANCSMEVCHADSQIIDRQQDFQDSQMSVRNMNIRGDNPLPLEEGLLRRLTDPADNIPPLMQAVDMDVAAEEEVFTSSDSVSSTQSNPGPVFQNPTKVVQKQRQQLTRNSQARTDSAQEQVSCNSRQPEFQDDRHMIIELQGPHGSMGSQYSRSQISTNCIRQASIHCAENASARHGQDMCTCPRSDSRHCTAGAEFCVQNGQINQGLVSHSADPGLGMMAVVNGGPRQPTGNQFTAFSYSELNQVVPNPGGGVVSRGMNGAVGRMGDGGVAMGGAIPKKHAAPKVKLADICRGSRKVKVFVTYASDNDKHKIRVVRLSECLEKNGFYSCLDMKQIDQMMEDRMGWYDKHFSTADFVLVCVSPLYKQQSEQNDSVHPNNSYDTSIVDSTHQDNIHTKYIYKLMQSEFVRNQSRNKRFIPLLFPHATRDHVPSWLQNTLIYQWPDQYKDLFWMLTRPQDRVCSAQESHHSNGME